MGRDRRKTSIEWPTFVDDRLRLLVALAQDTDTVGPTSAAELLCALVCEQDLDGETLAGAIQGYRRTDPEVVAAVTARHRAAGPPRRGRPRRGPAQPRG